MREIVSSPADRPTNVDPGPAPMLEWIKIERLVVDDTYQRELKRANWTSIRRIASDFKWSRFSPVFCAPIEGGFYAIIDGQHRTHAAAICGFATVPCQIVQMTKDEQAASFAAVNGMVTRVTSANLHKAALAAGDAWAVEARDVAEQAGCKLMISAAQTKGRAPGQIFAPKAFSKVIATRGADHVTAALKLLITTDGYGDTLEAWDTVVLQPLIMGLTAKPEYLDDPRMRRCLEDFPLWDSIDHIQDETKRRLRLGLPYDPKKEQLQASLERWIEKAMEVTS